MDVNLQAQRPPDRPGQRLHLPWYRRPTRPGTLIRHVPASSSVRPLPVAMVEPALLAALVVATSASGRRPASTR